MFRNKKHINIHDNDHEWIRQCIKEQGLGTTAERASVLQILWGGYGHILRINLQQQNAATVKRSVWSCTTRSVIAKVVNPPRLSSETQRISDNRKKRSYDVEMTFYLNFANAPIAHAPTAKCYFAKKTESGWHFLFEDLCTRGFMPSVGHIKVREIRECLRWLAGFHSCFMGVKAEGLWETGTYWHLETRQEELKKLSDDWQTLAGALDSKLNECRYKTIVHGDAKIDNFLLSADADVAAVDFQYVGSGCGMKDVVYFLSSCMTEDECEAGAAVYLDAYFDFLKEYLTEDRKWSIHDIAALESEWKMMFSVAWADFHRFLLGWDPDHWKIHQFSDKMTVQAKTILSQSPK